MCRRARKRRREVKAAAVLCARQAKSSHECEPLIPLAAWWAYSVRARTAVDPGTLTKRYLIPVKRLIYVLSVCYLCIRDVCLWCQYFRESTGRETLVLHILGWSEFLSTHPWGWTGTGRGCAASKDPQPRKDWGCHQPRVPGKPSQCHHHINGSDNWLLIRAHLGLDITQEVIDLVVFHSHDYLLKLIEIFLVYRGSKGNQNHRNDVMHSQRTKAGASGPSAKPAHFIKHPQTSMPLWRQVLSERHPCFLAPCDVSPSLIPQHGSEGRGSPETHKRRSHHWIPTKSLWACLASNIHFLPQKWGEGNPAFPARLARWQPTHWGVSLSKTGRVPLNHLQLQLGNPLQEFFLLSQWVSHLANQVAHADSELLGR